MIHDDEACCRDVVEHASAFLDGELEGERWACFEAHLRACPPCGEYVRQVGLTVEALRRLPGRRGQHLRGELLERFRSWKAGG